MRLPTIVRRLFRIAARVATIVLAPSVVASVVAYSVLPEFLPADTPGCYVTDALVSYIECGDFAAAAWLARFLNLPGILVWGAAFSVFALLQTPAFVVTVIQTSGLPPGSVPLPDLLMRELAWLAYAVLGPLVIILAITGFRLLLGDFKRWRTSKG